MHERFTEEWREIPGFPEYQVSSHGRVRSYYKANGYGGGFTCDRSITPNILRQTPLKKSGHMRVYLYHNGIKVSLLVHRLVAIAFIPNPNGYPKVRHRDDNPKNNNVENLEWGTQGDNIRDCIERGRFNYSGMIEYNNARRTPIRAYNPDTDSEMFFDSQSDVARYFNTSQGNIWNAIKRGTKRCGYIFEYDNMEAD